jgi:hypothetical protein
MRTHTIKPLPRISNRPVVQYGDEARHRRLRSAPRHPDAAYTIPDRKFPRWVIDVILLGVAVATLLTIF